jgi:hypothetical protein
MNATTAQEIAHLEEVTAGIERLARLQQNAPLLSCYLDLRPGMPSVLAYLEKAARGLTQCLSGQDRKGLEESLMMVESFLLKLPQDAKGLALFVRGKSQGHFHLAMPMAVPLANQLTYHQTPDLYPLILMRENYGCYWQLSFRRAWRQTREINLGDPLAQAWSAMPGLLQEVNSGSFLNWLQAREKPLDYQPHLKWLITFLKDHPDIEVILDGPDDLIRPLVRELPLLMRSRIVDTLTLPEEATDEEVLEASLAAYRRHRESHAETTADQMVQAKRASGPVVTGIAAALEVLRQKRASHLYLTKGIQHGSLWSCAQCGKTLLDSAAENLCRGCEANVHPFDPYADAVRLAVKQSIPITLVDANHKLSYLGAVGCYLGQLKQPMAGSVTPHESHWELVA